MQNCRKQNLEFLQKYSALKQRLRPGNSG